MKMIKVILWALLIAWGVGTVTYAAVNAADAAPCCRTGIRLP